MKKLILLFTILCLKILCNENQNQHVFIKNNLSVKSKKLKILFVLHEFPKYNQPFILNQITGLIDLGHEIFIYANHKKNVHISSIIEKYKLLEKTYYQYLPEDFNDVDIIYAQFGLDGYVGLMLKEVYGLSGKLVTCFRGDDISKFIFSNIKGKKSHQRGRFRVPCYFLDMYKLLFDAGDYFLPVCNYFVGKLKVLGCDFRKIGVHHSSIDVDSFQFKKRKKQVNESINIVSVGRLTPLKGMKYLIKAFAKVIEKNKNEKLKLYIVGDGPEKEALLDFVYDLKIENDVIFTGSLAHEKIKQILYKSHIFVLSSVTEFDGTEEGIPNALMEAMATGMPVVSTKHSGIPELIIDRETGFLVEECNVSELALTLGFLVQNPQAWLRVSRKARRYVKSFHDISTEILKLEALFYRLIA